MCKLAVSRLLLDERNHDEWITLAGEGIDARVTGLVNQAVLENFLSGQ